MVEIEHKKKDSANLSDNSLKSRANERINSSSKNNFVRYYIQGLKIGPAMAIAAVVPLMMNQPSALLRQLRILLQGSL